MPIGAALFAAQAHSAELRVLGPTHFGQLGQDGINYVSSPVDLGETAVEVSVGYSHVLFIDDAGTLWAFGDNSRGQLGDGTFAYRKDPVQVDQNVEQIHAGYASSFYVKTDGTLYAMGSPGGGLWGGANQGVTAEPIVIINDGVEKALLGESHAVFLLDDGTLHGTGLGVYLGAPTTQVSTNLFPVAPEMTVTDVALTNSGIFYTTEDGILYGIGYRIPGGEEDLTLYTDPLPIASGVTSLAAGEDVVLYVNGAGTLYSLGMSEFGALGLGRDDTVVGEPTQVATGVSDVATDGESSFYIDTQGRLFAFGLNLYGQLGDGTFRDRYSPVQVATGIEDVSTERSTSMFVDSNGNLSGAGNIALLQMEPFETSQWPALVTDAASRVFVGMQNVFYIDDNGDLYGMGRNDKGQLGTGEFGHRATPQLIASDVVDMEAGVSHSAYVNAEGDLFVTGDNGDSQLGGDEDEIATPVRLAVADSVQDVEIGDSSTLWIDSVGNSLWLVADPENEEFFHESETVNMPFRVAEDVKDVSADHAIFYVTTSNQLWVRGATIVEQLKIAGSKEPEANGTLLLDTDVSEVESSADYALYLKNDGTLWGIGRFPGFGNRADPLYREPVLIDESVVDMTTGEEGFLYKTEDDALWLRAQSAGAAQRYGYQSSEYEPGQSVRMWPGATVHDFALNDYNTAIVVDPVSAPTIQAADVSTTSVRAGEGALLSLDVTETISRIIWYRGAVGDTSDPMAVEGLTEMRVYPYEDTQYWARVSNEEGEASTSSAFSVTVENPEYAAWATENNLAGSAGLHTEDADGDSIINGLEYAFGLNPLVPDLQAPALLYLAEENTFQYVHPLNPEASVTIVYQTSDDLQTWEAIPESRIQELDNDIILIEYGASEIGSQSFFRVGVSGIE